MHKIKNVKSSYLEESDFILKYFSSVNKKEEADKQKGTSGQEEDEITDFYYDVKGLTPIVSYEKYRELFNYPLVNKIKYEKDIMVNIF